VVVFDKGNYKKGDYVDVLVHSCSVGTLFGEPVK
jgi:tRNA-2-methylthio-N6-dimethylallyladenosine synthase